MDSNKLFEICNSNFKNMPSEEIYILSCKDNLPFTIQPVV